MNEDSTSGKSIEWKQIERAQQDQRYFGVLYETHFTTIYRFTFKRLGGNEEIAGDLTQQTFIKAMANIGTYQYQGLPFVAWLYRIAQNEVNMYFRSQKKHYFVEINERQMGEIVTEINGDSTYTESDIEQLIQQINNLEPTQIDLIELRFFQGMSFKEIADIYSISEANAKMKTYRLLEKIKHQWKNPS